MCIHHQTQGSSELSLPNAGEIIGILDKRIAEAGNRRRQTVLLSATLHDKLESLATLSLQDPAAIGFGIQARTPVLFL